MQCISLYVICSFIPLIVQGCRFNSLNLYFQYVEYISFAFAFTFVSNMLWVRIEYLLIGSALIVRIISFLSGHRSDEMKSSNHSAGWIMIHFLIVFLIFHLLASSSTVPFPSSNGRFRAAPSSPGLLVYSIQFPHCSRWKWPRRFEAQHFDFHNMGQLRVLGHLYLF